MRWCFLVVSLLIVYPATASAAVVINEVAWMGDTVSANHEWIELYNDGAAESLDGWVLTDGVNLSIALSGTVPGNSFVVLERTNDDSAQGGAFLLYTGALVNTGATLALKRADGTIMDQVSGGENWGSIGGDNVTKATAQYTGGGWVTAAATPGSANATVSDETDEETTTDEDEEEEVADEKEDTDDTDTETVGTKTRSASPKVPVRVPSDPTVRITMPAQVYVNQLVEAEALVSNVGKVIEQSMVRSWNFGDATTGVGKEASHRFAYPGEYIVSVRATYKDFTAHDKVVVTVLPTSLSLTINDNGDIQLHNNAKYEVDVSGYTVSAGKSVVLPPDTFMRPRATITLPRSQVGYVGHMVTVRDDIGQLVTSSVAPALVAFEALAKESIAAQVSAPPVLRVLPVAAVIKSSVEPKVISFVPGVSALALASEIAEVVPTPQPLAAASAHPNVALVADAAMPISKSSYPFMALGAVVLIGVLAVAAGRVRPPHAPSTPVAGEDASDPFPFR